MLPKPISKVLEEILKEIKLIRKVLDNRKQLRELQVETGLLKSQLTLLRTRVDLLEQSQKITWPSIPSPILPGESPYYPVPPVIWCQTTSETSTKDKPKLK